jgi:hypothetical protein
MIERKARSMSMAADEPNVPRDAPGLRPLPQFNAATGLGWMQTLLRGFS